MSLTDYPVDYTSPAVRELLGVLASTYYRVDDVVRVLQDAGLPPHEVDLGGTALAAWRSALDVAGGRGVIDALLGAVKKEKPALVARLDELASPTATVEARPAVDVAAYDAPGWKNFSGDGQAEAVIVAEEPTFLDVAFLELGVVRARSVCRLATKFPGEGSGTAFRIGPRHLLTNHHVLFNHDDGDRKVTAVQAWFNYQTDTTGSLATMVQIDGDVDSVVGEKDDDWAIVLTISDIPDDFPTLSLVDGPVPVVDQRVCIIQHPYGAPKKVAFQHNLVRAVMDDKFQYWTDTDVGSSGSPVFDEQWRVVGLHHYSVPAPESDHTTFRNQGRRIDRVVARMQALGVMPS